MFKQECYKFLDMMVSLRANAINDAVAKALASEHAKYVEELTDAKNIYIAEETQKTQAAIRKLQEELEAKKVACTNDTEIAIKAHKEQVTANAKEQAAARYDRFISEVSQSVDRANIN